MRKSKDFAQIGRRPKGWTVSQTVDENGETIRIYKKKRSVLGIEIIQHKGDIVDWTPYEVTPKIRSILRQ